MVNGIVRVVKGNQRITRGCYAIEAKKSNANTLAGCARKLKKKKEIQELVEETDTVSIKYGDP